MVFKAMGKASDQEIMHLIGADSTFTQLLLPSVQDCRKEGVFTPTQALQYLGTPLSLLSAQLKQPSMSSI